MENLQDYLPISDAQRQRFAEMYRRYRRLYEDPEHCLPLFLINVPAPNLPTWDERLADPDVMLKAELDTLRPHLEIGDDRVPTVRVQFGTAQVAAAFGCRITVPPNSLPAAASHVLSSAEAVYALEKPALDAGWYGKLYEWTARWQEQLPEGIHIQHPDIQSAFNSAHLIRGNDILTDFYDAPEAVDRLLDVVTDFMIDITRHCKQMISQDTEWFFDWGALWKGAARISNCSMHMISAKFYREHILARDIRFFEAIGGGRMHYCGTSDAVIDEFFKVPAITGLDYDAQYHDLWSLCERAPKQVTLLHWGSEKTLARLLHGEWPRKRNLILQVNAASVEAGKALLSRLRESAAAFYGA
ncbi:MAG TPA: uroporphyrinogen decarboxylase family protein [Armatimonadota bacterium]|nr:uroporphyrinogen decarboxylase family protein [Armatimonadota bacterium]